MSLQSESRFHPCGEAYESVQCCQSLLCLCAE